MESASLYSIIRERLPKYAPAIIAETTNADSELCSLPDKFSDVLKRLLTSIRCLDETDQSQVFEGALCLSPQWVDIKGAPSILGGRYIDDTAVPDTHSVRVLVEHDGVLQALELPRTALQSLLVAQLSTQSPTTAAVSEDRSSVLFLRGKPMTVPEEVRHPRHCFGSGYKLRPILDRLAPADSNLLPGIERVRDDYCRVSDVEALLAADLERPELLRLRAEFLYHEFGRLPHTQQRADEDLSKASGMKDDPDIWYQRAMIWHLAIRDKDVRKCLEYFARLFWLNPLDAVAYYQRGEFYVRHDMLKLALEDFETAIEIDPGNFWAHSDRGRIFAGEGNEHAALRDYIRAFDLRRSLEPGEDERNWSSYRLPVIATAIELREWDLALEQIGALEKACPTAFPQMIAQRAKIYSFRGRMTEALLDIDAAIRQCETDEGAQSWFYQLRGDIRVRMGGNNAKLGEDDLRKAAELRLEEKEWEEEEKAAERWLDEWVEEQKAAERQLDEEEVVAIPTPNSNAPNLNAVLSTFVSVAIATQTPDNNGDDERLVQDLDAVQEGQQPGSASIVDPEPPRANVADDEDLLRDLNAFKESQQPARNNIVDADPPSTDVAVRMHAVQLAMQQIAALEKERAGVVAEFDASSEGLANTAEAFLTNYKTLERPELFREIKTCPKHNFYTHSVFYFQWFDENEGRMRWTAPSELCHSDLCETGREVADRELFKVRTETFKSIQRLQEQLHAHHKVGPTSIENRLADIDARLSTYRAMVESTLGVKLPPAQLVVTRNAAVPQARLGDEILPPAFTITDPRTTSERDEQKRKIIAALRSRQIPRELFLQDRHGDWLRDGFNNPRLKNQQGTFQSITQVISVEHQNDRDVCLVLALLLDLYDSSEMGPLIRKFADKQFCLEAFQMGANCYMNYVVPGEVRDDDNLILAAIKSDPECVMLVSERLASDKRFAIRVLQDYPNQAKKLFCLRFAAKFEYDAEVLRLSGFRDINDFRDNCSRYYHTKFG